MHLNDGAGIEHFPLAIGKRPRRTKTCVGVDALGELPAITCSEQVTYIGCSSRRNRCPKCRKEQARRVSRKDPWQYTRSAERPPDTPFDQAHRSEYMATDLEAECADESLRELGIVIRRNGRPYRVWVAEIMAVARGRGLVKWRGAALPDDAFASVLALPAERCGFVRRN